MATPKFFHQISPLVVGETVLLSEEETRHASLARRLQPGSEVILLDGQGGVAKGHFVELNKRVGRVSIEQLDQHGKPKHTLAIASAVPKGDRQKIMLDMLTQVGVTDFIPLHCEFSVTQATDKAIAKWERVIIEACKQSANPYQMAVHTPLTVAELIGSELWSNSDVFRAEQTAYQTSVSADRNLLAVIGPEAGFSSDEICQLDAANAVPISLSKHILRTETAAVSIASALAVLKTV